MYSESDKNFTMRMRFHTYIEKISVDDIFTQAAALAYFAVLALAPLIIILMSFLSFMSSDLQNQLKIQTLKIIGVEGLQVLEAILISANRRPDLSVVAGWVGVFLLAVSGSVVFAQLHSVLNTIFRVDISSVNHIKIFDYLKKMISRRLYSVVILLSFILFSILSLIVSTVLSQIIGGTKGLAIDIATLIINIGVYALFFSIIYMWIPDRNIRFSKGLLGGILTAALFILGKYLVAIYIAQVAISSAFGAAGSLVALLIWIYYSALVFFLGAEFLEVFLIDKQTQK